MRQHEFVRSFATHNFNSLQDSHAVIPRKLSSTVFLQAQKNVIGLQTDGVAILYNKLPAWFLKVIDAIVLVTFILIESILKNVFRKDIPKKKKALYHCPGKYHA